MASSNEDRVAKSLGEWVRVDVQYFSQQILRTAYAPGMAW